MALNITVPPDTEARLRERAEAQGEDVASYAARLLREAVASPSIEDLLAPFRQQVDESGMTNEQLDDFYDDLRDKAFHDRTTKKAHRV